MENYFKNEMNSQNYQQLRFQAGNLPFPLPRRKKKRELSSP
jgi:hypothetical protein